MQQYTTVWAVTAEPCQSTVTNGALPGENEGMGQERITQLRKSFLSSTLNEFLGLVNKNITIPLFYRTSELSIRMHWNGELLFTPQKNEKKLYYTGGLNVVVSLKLSMNNISERKFTYNALIFDWARGKVCNWDNQKNQAFDAINLISTILHSFNSCHGIGMFMTSERTKLFTILLVICQRNGACFLIDSSKEIFWNRTSNG